MIRDVRLSFGERDYLPPKLRNTVRNDNAVSNQNRVAFVDNEFESVDSFTTQHSLFAAVFLATSDESGQVETGEFDLFRG